MTNYNKPYGFRPRPSKWKQRIKMIVMLIALVLLFMIFSMHMNEITTECEAKGGHIVEDYRGLYVCTE